MNFILNDEQILELCLIACSHNPNLLEDFPGEFLVYYVLKNSTKSLNFEEISEEISNLIASHTMESLVKKGFLETSFDEDGEIRVGLTGKILENE